MPKVKISEYSATANSNTDVASINIDEGCAPSGINNAIRAVMGHLKDFQQGTYGDPFNGPVNGTVGATTPSTGAFTTLTASGNVGVGGTTNSYGSQTTLTLSGTNVSRIDFRSNSTFTGTILSYQAVTEGLRLQTEAGYPITFYPAGTKAATIDTAGNLGLGVTPSAWTSIFKAVQVKQGSISTDSSNNTTFANNCYFDGANWKYINTAASQQYLQYAGLHIWNTAASGTAGNAISFTQAMTLDASGNLLVGTTSGANHIINRTITTGTILTVKSNGTGSVDTAYFNYCNATGASLGTEAGFYIQKHSTSGRSINAAGTINASGADYAEYMTKAGDFTVAKGDVIGIDANGKLTNVFANAMSFMVKSTDPSYVGGDSWGNEEALGLSMPENPSQRQATEEVEAETDEEFAVRQAQYESDKSAFDVALEAARQRVDRIAFAGQVPVNVMGATAGQYIIPVNDNGAIKGEAVSNPTFEQYQTAVGKVIAIESDGRAKIIVKVA